MITAAVNTFCSLIVIMMSEENEEARMIDGKKMELKRKSENILQYFGHFENMNVRTKG